MMLSGRWLSSVLVILAGLATLSACALMDARQMTSLPAASEIGQPIIPPLPPLDLRKVGQGEALYNQYCAGCHGVNGEGQSDWKIPNEDGSFKPPPHDNSGHTWHHADDLLLDLIANGSDFPQTRMPAFGGQLSQEEILAVVEYLKNWWGPEERAFQWQVTYQTRQQPP